MVTCIQWLSEMPAIPLGVRGPASRVPEQQWSMQAKVGLPNPAPLKRRLPVPKEGNPKTTQQLVL